MNTSAQNSLQRELYWKLFPDEEYIRVMEVFEKAHQAGKLTPLGEDVRKRLAIVWADAEGRGGDLSPVGVDQQRGIKMSAFK